MRDDGSPLLGVKVSKCAPDGPDEFLVQATIEKTAEHIYALVDWADERNKWRQTGDEVTALDEEGRHFRLVVQFMRDVQFDYEVIEASKPHVYACVCVPTPSVGHLVRSDEHYRIEPVGETQSLVTYTMTAHFESGLGERQSAEVRRNMTIACHNTLAKLKANAEHGVGTVEAFENTRLMPM